MEILTPHKMRFHMVLIDARGNRQSLARLSGVEFLFSKNDYGFYADVALARSIIAKISDSVYRVNAYDNWSAWMVREDHPFFNIGSMFDSRNNRFEFLIEPRQDTLIKLGKMAFKQLSPV